MPLTLTGGVFDILQSPAVRCVPLVVAAGPRQLGSHRPKQEEDADGDDDIVVDSNEEGDHDRGVA